VVERLSIEPGRAPFVGRVRELELLDDLARRATGGEPQAVFIEGGPGLGKTRLLEEVSGRLGAAGWTVLRGDCGGLPAAAPYGPFVAAARSYMDGRGVDAVRRAAGDWARHLAPVLPELEPSARAGAPRADAAAVLEAWARTIRSLAGGSPALVAIDDLQWADAASLDLLRYLRSRLRGTPLFLACAQRDERTERGAVDGATGLAADLGRARLATRLLLGRLDAVSSVRLAQGLLDAAAGPRLAEVVAREGEGDPFIVEELVRGLADEGRLARTSEGAIELVDEAPAGLPPGVRDALEARLAGLDPDVRRTVAHAAVGGRRVSVRIAAAAANRPADAVEADLAAAARRGFVHADGPDAYAFAHDKIREALYAGLAAGERRRAHDRVVDALLADPDGADAAHAAHHAVRGEDPARAVGPLLAAGAAAAGTGAHLDAARHLAAAVAILRSTGDADELAAALGRLGASLADAGAYDDAIAALDEALRLRRSPGCRPGPVEAAALLERLGAIHLAREEPDLAEDALVAASRELDHAREGGPDLAEARARVGLLLARLHISVTGRLTEGSRLADEVLASAAASGDLRTEAASHGLLGQAAMHGGDFDAGRRHFDAAIARVDAVRDPALAADAADGLARLHYWTASFLELESVAARELEASRRSGDPHRLGWPTFWLAQASLGLARWDEARTRAAELVDLGERLGARRMLGQGHELLGLVAWWTGALEDACTELATGVDHLRRIGPGTLVYYLGPFGLALAAAGRAPEAEAVLAELDALARTFPPGSSPRVQAFNVGARIGLAVGRPDLSVVGELRRAEGQFHWFPVATTLALLELPSDPAAAGRHAAAARRMLAGGGGDVHLAGALAVEAAIAERRGDPAAAGRLRREALALARARGASAAAAGIPAGQAGSLAIPPGGELSPREIEVLALVAAGRTNREIAEELAISEKTAINHVTHILDKLGASNRAAAASWAVRNGLT
jgi:DNA-binding CsgD family transcriptional regulator/tetratricopeptide (TPR) repeat protein